MGRDGRAAEISLGVFKYNAGEGRYIIKNVSKHRTHSLSVAAISRSMPTKLLLHQFSGTRHRLRNRPSGSARGLRRPNIILRLPDRVQLRHLR